MRKAIILMGPPGAGKGTQAELLAYKFSLIHFDSGRYVEHLFQENKMPSKIRKQFIKGDLLDPVWILKASKEQIKRIGDIGLGIVFSGSARTVFEAFGDKRTSGIMEMLAKIYGKKNVFVFELSIPTQTTISRDSKRRVCEVCWKPHLLGSSLKKCPFCGGKLIRRVQDKVAILKHRLKEYEERTKPALKQMKLAGFKVIKIDGRPKPTIVFNQIIRRLR